MRRKKKGDFQLRDKFFYAVPSLFPKWDYPSRLAIGVNLNDFKARNAPFYNFRIKDKMYRISRERAEIVGRAHTVSFGKMPHLIPKEEFEVVEENLPAPVEYEYDLETNVAYVKGTKPKKEPVQTSLL